MLHDVEINPTPDQLILRKGLSYPKAIHNASVFDAAET